MNARQRVPVAGEDGLRRAELAALMRPALPALVDGIVTEVWRAVPVYARPGSYGRVTRHGVECAVALFVDLVQDPMAPRDELYETCRRLGAGEAHEGRTLDDLQAAYRVGTRVGWHWIMRLGRRHQLSSATMARLAEMLFGYADELARMSIRGHREATRRHPGRPATTPAAARHRTRRRPGRAAHRARGRGRLAGAARGGGRGRRGAGRRLVGPRRARRRRRAAPVPAAAGPGGRPFPSPGSARASRSARRRNRAPRRIPCAGPGPRCGWRRTARCRTCPSPGARST